MKILALFDRKLLKFILVGLVNTITGSLIMFLLYNAAHFSYWFSSASNYILTSILSLFLHKYYTYRIKRWSVFLVLGFYITIAVSYIIAYGIARPVMNLILSEGSLKLRENAALLTGMCISAGLNYLGQRLIVFREKEENNE